MFKPTRPVFTELVPTHERYIGGKFYFEDSQNPVSLAYHLYCPVDPKELDALTRPDGRRFKPDNALTTNSIPVLRKAIVTFVVGGVIRRLQAEHEKGRKNRYSFIIHTEARRGAHQWQETVVEAVIHRLQDAAGTDRGIFMDLVKEAYDDLAKSINLGGFFLPEYKDVLPRIQEYLPAVQVEKVNSEKDINQLLDRDGQLELRNPLNIFIGGQILDRGITVANLIGFYYGRRANRFQQDTVLQHSRMYGARPMADLAVTRFYTSPQIYQVLKTIHDFDSGLRTAFENGGHDAGVVFIQQENGRIIPCSPNKVLLSTLMTVGPGKRLLPIGFQTGFKTHVQKLIDEVDARVNTLMSGKQPEAPTMIALEQAYEILDTISKTLEFEEGYEWNVNAVKACLGYVSAGNTNYDEKGKLHLLVRRNRDNNRMRADGRRFFDAPDTSHIEGTIARKIGATAPVLILFRQNGSKEKGWRDCPFWWSVIHMPQSMRTVVYANDTYDANSGESDGVDDAG